MRNLKKFLALVLAMVMVVGATAVVSADFTDVPADNRYYNAITDLAVKGIVKGATETTFAPTADVTRTQMAIMLARTISGDTENDDRWANGIVPYTDVTEYAGAIEYVQVKGLINGWNDAVTGQPVFGPKDNVTYVQALKMGLGALGYTEELSWPWGYYNKAVEAGLTYNMDINDLDAELNRAETAQIIYNVLYAEPAKGGLTIAETNFGIATANNTSLFAITATPKQFYAEDAEADDYNSNSSEVDGDYVGLQALVNGVPNGNMIYVPVEKLGIAVADVENYFNYAVELVNYDEKTGDFDNAILGEAPTVVDNTAVTTYNTNGNADKIRINGKTYTTVNVLTNATLNNEIVVYDGSLLGGRAEMLVMDEDGYVYVDDDDAVGKLAYTSSSGTAYYHVYDGGKLGQNANKGKIVSESVALAMWGVEVLDEAGAYVEYAFKNGREMYTDAYQLALYDDDRDGLYERAVYTPIYMGVYYTYKANVSGADSVCDGLVREIYAVNKDQDDNNDINTKVADIKYTNEAAKENGAISVFTYNAQLKTVNVIDVLEVQTGTVDKVTASGFRSSTNNTANTVKLTVDGTVYTVAYNFIDVRRAVDGHDNRALDDNTMLSYYVAPSKLGAKVNEVDKYSSWTVEDLGEEAFLEIYGTGDEHKDDLTNLVDVTKVGMDIAFVAYNGYILMYDKIDSDNAYNFTVVQDWDDFDLGEIYMDLWIAGEIEEDATVTVIDGKELADLSTTKFSLLLSKDELFWPGNIYTMDIVDGNYELTELVVLSELDVDTDDDNRLGFNKEYELYNVKYADDVYATIDDNGNITTDLGDDDAIGGTGADADIVKPEAEYVGMLEFDNGNVGTNKDQMLRTNDDTIFYFITYSFENNDRVLHEIDDEYETEVDVFTGDVADDLFIKFDKHTQIWTDSIGRGEDRASVVFVVDAVEHNFFASDIRVVIGSFANRHALDVDDAEDFGLPEKYEGETIYAYNGTYIDPLTGEKVASTIYSVRKITDKNGNSATYINEDDVMCDANGIITGAAIVNCADVTAKSYDEAEQELTITNVLGGLTYIAAERDYDKYGITDCNGNTTSSSSSAWGPNNKDDVLRYTDWYYAKEKKLNKDGFEDIPKYIQDVELIEITKIIEIDYDDDELKKLDVNIGVNYTVDDTKSEITERANRFVDAHDEWINVIDKYNADEVEVVVYTWGSTSAITGEEAYELLATAPMVWFMMDIDAEATTVEDMYSFDSAMDDGVMEFYIMTTANDK